MTSRTPRYLVLPNPVLHRNPLPKSEQSISISSTPKMRLDWIDGTWHLLIQSIVRSLALPFHTGRNSRKAEGQIPDRGESSWKIGTFLSLPTPQEVHNHARAVYHPRIRLEGALRRNYSDLSPSDGTGCNRIWRETAGRSVKRPGKHHAGSSLTIHPLPRKNAERSLIRPY
jgi:hypothetical protein